MALPRVDTPPFHHHHHQQQQQQQLAFTRLPHDTDTTPRLLRGVSIVQKCRKR